MRHRSAFASTAAFAIILSVAVATSSDRDRITLGDLASISATREPSRDHRQNSSELNFAPTPATITRMLELLLVVVRARGLSPGESLAESVRGTRDRLNPSRMPGSCDRAQSGASATRPHDLQPVLSSESDASGAQEGRARSPTRLGAVHWAHHRDSEVGGLHHRYERQAA